MNAHASDFSTATPEFQPPPFQPAHALEHARLADTLSNMCRCPVWGLPEPLFQAATLAIDRLNLTAREGVAFPTGWELVRAIDPGLHEELAAFEACAALQRMEGVSEPGRQPWSRDRCHDALRTLRALSAHQQRVAQSSYASPPARHGYAPVGLEPMGTSPGIGLCLPR